VTTAVSRNPAGVIGVRFAGEPKVEAFGQSIRMRRPVDLGGTVSGVVAYPSASKVSATKDLSLTAKYGPAVRVLSRDLLS
jgi:hypothetical protein